MKFETLTIINTDWCYLYSIYNLRTGELECPGVRGMYSAETADGIPYLTTTVGHDQKTGKPMVMRDAELSLVYPGRVFAYGENEARQLTHDEVRECLQELGLRSYAWDPVMLHRGYDKGATTWYSAWKATTEMGPRIWDVRRALHANDCRWEITENRTFEFWGNSEGFGILRLFREAAA